MKGPRPSYLPPQFHWTLYQDTTKHRWADIAYLLAVDLAQTQGGKSALDLINEYNANIEEIARATS